MSDKGYTIFIIVYAYFLSGALGLVMGSFCNAWAWRIVSGEKITKGRSHCTSCGHTLYAKDLVPLFSWLFLKGRCRYCGEKISARYPIAELISAAYYISIFTVYGFSWDTIRFLILGSLLLVSSLVDFDTMELPDGLTIAMAGFSLMRLLNGTAEWKSMALGFATAIPLLALVLIMDKVLGKESMGGGDIKLFAALGLHFGPLKMLLLIIISCVVGLIAAAMQKKGASKPFPFGPALAAGAWITALFGDIIINAYLSLF